MWPANGSTANLPKEQSRKRQLDRFKESYTHGGREEVATPISNIDSFVKHVYTKHNQEADHWANIGAQQRRKIVIDRRDQSTVWKAIRGFWVGSFKDTGRSGCGIVIKGVDREIMGDNQ